MKQLFGLGAFKNAPIRKKLILSTWLVAIVPIVVIFAVVFLCLSIPARKAPGVRRSCC